MFLGYDFFQLDKGTFFETQVYHPSYNKVEMSGMVLDELFGDKDITIPVTIDKPTGWNYTTVIDAKLKGDLEGGSVSAGGFEIEKIKFQKRRVDELYWEDLAIIDYEQNKQLLYEAIDKFVQNDFIYEYSLIPVTATIFGNTVIREQITVDFDGVFLSDRNNNYKLLYNLETDDIEHNIASATLQPINSQFPIISYGETDYRSGGITALFLSGETVNANDGKVRIRMEKLGREKLMKFLKNQKPKILRHQNGDMMLINIVGNPKEVPNNSISGIANVSFNYVEVGNTDDDTLKTNGMLIGFEEEF